MNDEFKKVLFDLMKSHSKLAQAEYDRNPSYNNEHFSYKAEEQMVQFLNKKDSSLINEFLKDDKFSWEN